VPNFTWNYSNLQSVFYNLSCVTEDAGIYNDVSNQQDVTTFSFIDLFKLAQNVSGDIFAHLQEHFLSLYTAFVTMHCNVKL